MLALVDVVDVDREQRGRQPPLQPQIRTVQTDRKKKTTWINCMNQIEDDIDMHYSKTIQFRRSSYVRRPRRQPSDIRLCPTANSGRRK
jgi:hypothetical protein